MKKYERDQAHGRVHDVVTLPAVIAGETDSALQAVGFVPTGEVLAEDAGDEDGIPWPPSRALACGGGIQQFNLWSRDKEGGGVGFQCTHEVMKGILYAQIALNDDEGNRSVSPKTLTQNSMKGAITTLLDIAEANQARKITLGLSQEHSQCAEFICSLLYLGFQVAPSRKSPFFSAALLLDFDIGCQLPFVPPFSDQTYTGTSECSTSADDVEPCDNASESE